MKLSESWLREWVDPSLSTKELVDQITMAGLEVDAVEPVAGKFSGVIVGEIINAEQHPDADKLRVCKVLGSPEGEMQVVCGAHNARPGIKIPFALVGAKLPGDFKIKKAKLRGVESFGMLCAQTELQAGDDDDGLWELPEDAPVGEDLRSYLKLDDNIIEVDLTPNRSDCLSLKGLAREVGVLNRVEVRYPEITKVAPQADDTPTIKLAAPNACSRYVGRIIKGVNVKAPTPLWMVEKLRRSGIRSIDPIVDVTNFVLLEQGQPMHAFDLAKLDGEITVRMAKQNEEIELLDGQTIKLNDDTLAITDNSGAIAVAGIMGGASTAVSDSTQDIMLESAFFEPVAIAGRARSYGLHTDSSHRFERGVDYNGAETAMERATELLTQIVGGTVCPIVVEEDNDNLPAQRTVTLSKSRILSGLGFSIPDAEVEEILNRLGLSTNFGDSNGWEFSIPSYRFDIAIEADLLEELARIYGYNELPISVMRIPAELPQATETKLSVSEIEQTLINRDYNEVISYSFVDPKLHALFDKSEGVALLNPISEDLGVMRSSILPGLVKTLQSNIKRQHSRVRIFEKGLRFFESDTADNSQQQSIAGLLYGSRDDQNWTSNKDEVDFFDIKADVESILSIGAKQYRFEKAEVEYLHPGQTAAVKFDDVLIGHVGALHPTVTKELGIDKSVFVFELDLQAVLNANVSEYKQISKFPEVTRDLAVVIDRHTPVAGLKKCIENEAGEHFKNLKVFDVYSGEGIDPQRKSVAFSLTFQHSSRTLNDDEVNASFDAVVSRLKVDFDARLR